MGTQEVSGVKRVALLALVATSLFAEPQMSFLDNGHVKVGVDLSLGGAITWLSRDGGEKLVNSYDYGRQIQMSYYSGPVPFESGGQKPADHWRHLGWNPVQAGDDFKHGSKTVEHRNDGRTLYVKCIPLQWPLNNVPAECVFESWLELDGIALKGRARLTNARADKMRYPARHQEMPALYANAPFHRVVSYTGAKPFSGGEIQVIPKPQTKHPWAFWDATEQWSALLDKDDRGVGFIAPGVVRRLSISTLFMNTATRSCQVRFRKSVSGRQRQCGVSLLPGSLRVRGWDGITRTRRIPGGRWPGCSMSIHWEWIRNFSARAHSGMLRMRRC